MSARLLPQDVITGVGTVFSKSKHKNANNGGHNGTDPYAGHTSPVAHFNAGLRPEAHPHLNRPNSEELANAYESHPLSADERQLSLPNLDQLTDDDINLQFESMLVS